MLETVALGLLSGCPSTITSDSIDIPQPKKKRKQKENKNHNNNCTNMYFSLRDQGTPASALCTYIALERNEENVQKSNNERSLHPTETFSLKIRLGCFAFWNVGTQTAIPQSTTKNTYFYYGTFNEIKSFPKTDRQIPSRK